MATPDSVLVPPVQALPLPALLDRDHSILAFNERVLDWAYRTDVPLLERLRYLCIVSSNLDEFFEVRAESHLVAHQRQDDKGVYTVASFERLAQAAHTLVARQYALFNDDLIPTLEKKGSGSFRMATGRMRSVSGSSSISIGRSSPY